jgi:hypothetical protein
MKPRLPATMPMRSGWLVSLGRAMPRPRPDICVDAIR